MIRCWLTHAVLAVAVSVVLVMPTARPGHAESTWASIGPAWNGTVGELGLSREWLRDGVLLTGISGTHLARTRDHGETWQRVAVPTEGGKWGGGAKMLDGPTGRITFHSRSFPGRGTQSPWTTTLYRTADDGDSWAKVWEGGTDGTFTLLPSPVIQHDGILFMNFGFSLARSADAGATWEDIGAVWKTNVPGTRNAIKAVTLSPSFATDHTIVLRLGRAGDVDKLPPGLVQGLLISTDGGVTWQPLGTPTVDGSLHPTAESFLFSPGYAEDGTLFVIASNDGVPGRTGDATRYLFRSTDRGQTWNAVKGPLPWETFVALSPAFSQDQTVLVGALIRAVGAETTARCTMERSTDAGSTWSTPAVLDTFDKKRYYNTTTGVCDPLVVRQGPDGIVALSAMNVSTDLGLTWQSLATPTSARLRTGTFSPGFTQDGTIFFITEGAGIWAYGSRTQSAAGDLGCKVPLAEEIGNLYQKHPAVWATMGCPAEPATRERFTFGTAGYSNEIWSSPTNGVRLTQAQSGPSTTPGVDDFWSGSAKTAEMKFPRAPTEVADGLIQRFETGQVWAVFGPDGTLARVNYLEGVERGHYDVDYRPLEP